MTASEPLGFIRLACLPLEPKAFEHLSLSMRRVGKEATGRADGFDPTRRVSSADKQETCPDQSYEYRRVLEEAMRVSEIVDDEKPKPRPGPWECSHNVVGGRVGESNLTQNLGHGPVSLGSRHARAPFYAPSFALKNADIAPILPPFAAALRGIISTCLGPTPSQSTQLARTPSYVSPFAALASLRDPILLPFSAAVRTIIGTCLAPTPSPSVIQTKRSDISCTSALRLEI
jgi:hypothetical protein